jgi:flavorubredoxin
MMKKVKKSTVKRVLVITLGAIVAIMTIGFVLMNRLTAVFNNPAGNHTQALQTSQPSSPKALVLYQPSALSDITKQTAIQIAKGLNETGYEVIVNHPGSDLPKDLSAYAVVVFGSPVYGAKLSPVLLDYMKSVTLTSSQRVLIFDTGASDTSPELDDAASLMHRENVVKTKLVTTDNSKLQKAYKLGKSLQ